MCEVRTEGPSTFREAQDGHGHVGFLSANSLSDRLGLDDVALDRRARRVRAAHRLVEEGRVVLLASRSSGAEDLNTTCARRVGRRAGGQMFIVPMELFS